MRDPIRKEIQAEVFRRDRWLCRWCGCPVIFAPVMRYLAEFVKQQDVRMPRPTTIATGAEETPSCWITWER